jgi:hypothetical protein
MNLEFVTTAPAKLLREPRREGNSARPGCHDPGHVGTRDLEVEFLDVQSDSDRPNVKEALLTAVARIRARHEDQIEALLTTVDQLIANRANEEAEAVFEAAVRPLRGWKYQFCSD